MQLSAGDLRFRLSILSHVIREAQRDGDERWKKLAPQQQTINAALVERERRDRVERGQPEPKPVSVRLQTLKLKAPTGKRKEDQNE